MDNRMKISVGGDRVDGAGKGKNQPHRRRDYKDGLYVWVPISFQVNVHRPPRWCNLVQQQTKSLTMGVGRNPYLVHPIVFFFYLMVREQFFF